MNKKWIALEAIVSVVSGARMLPACSDDTSPSGVPEAGITEDGGASSTGGASSSGGAGGRSGAGGKSSGGSVSGTGGSATGGVPATGGRTSAGGSIAKIDAGRESDAGEAGTIDGGTSTVSIHFKAKVGSKDFACGTTYAAQGSTKVSVEPRDFRFYVQEVRLLDEHGTAVPLTLDTRAPWQTAEVALLDFEDGTGTCVDGNAEKNDVITGTVPNAKYSGLVFVNGVPDALNHGDPLHLPAPLQVGVMTWGWLFGFKFVKAELGATSTPAGDAEPGLGLIHLGSTGCNNVADGAMPDFMQPPTVACSNPNRNEIRLTGFDPGVNSVVADIGALFADVDLSENNQCHSEGASCPSEFAALGVDFATGTPKATQSVYRVE